MKIKKVYIVGFAGDTITDIFAVFDSYQMALESLSESTRGLTPASHYGWFILEKEMITEEISLIN